MQPTQYQWIREFAVFDFNGNKVLAKKKMVEEYVKNHGQAHEHEWLSKFSYFWETNVRSESPGDATSQSSSAGGGNG